MMGHGVSGIKKYILCTLVCVINLLLLNIWLRDFQTWSNINGTIVSTPNNTHHHNVTILLWHWPFGRVFSLKGDVCWDLYKIPGCKLVDQRSAFSKADIVVFHNRELINGQEKLPFNLIRPKSQRWAWMSLEAPENNGNLRTFANLFNLTVSYRRDADITVPYGELLSQDENPPVEVPPLNKTNLVCWVVSNYNSQHKRSQIYKQLNDIVSVKVYGVWNNAPLRAEELLPTLSHCFFYLAFENSISKDYITEKLWRNAYQSGAVPIVLGPSSEDYKAVAAPSSFIHVDEFASVKELAKHMQELAGDSQRYTDYLKWKPEWKVKVYTDWRERLCKICPLYHRLPQKKVYSDLHGYIWNN